MLVLRFCGVVIFGKGGFAIAAAATSFLTSYFLMFCSNIERKSLTLFGALVAFSSDELFADVLSFSCILADRQLISL